MALALFVPHYDLPRAGRALTRLLANPDDLPEVFTLIESLSGTAPHRLLFGFRRRASGEQLLRDQPDISKLLSDRAALAALPDGSLGRAYLAFVESEGISAEGIAEASKLGTLAVERPESFVYLHQRMRDTHDLWHAVTGYKGDVVGELALLAFNLGQHWNTGIALIVLAGLAKGFGRDAVNTPEEARGSEPGWKSFFTPNQLTRLVWDGYRRGRAAKWLAALPWESMLAQPLESVRKQLSRRAR